MKKRIDWWLILIGGVIAICLVACIGTAVLVKFSPNIYQKYLDNSSLKVGSTAPDFELPTLTGDRVRLSAFRGSPVLLSIGASWCPDCRVEAPILQELHEDHPDLVVLLVDSKENRETVQGFSDEFGFTFPVLLDEDGSVTNLYEIFAIPTELFIDAEGIVRAKMIESVTHQQLSEGLLLIGVKY